MNRYPSVDTYIKTISSDKLSMINEIRMIFLQISDIQESVRRDRLHYRFANGLWCYITITSRYVSIGFSRAAWLVHHYPIMGGLFDEMGKVIGKIKITHVSDIQHKGIPEFVEFVNQLPSGISVIIQ